MSSFIFPRRKEYEIFPDAVAIWGGMIYNIQGMTFCGNENVFFSAKKKKGSADLRFGNPYCP
jgi:hypothetical protein